MPKKSKQTKSTKKKAPSFYQAVGRRKEATARVRLYLQTAGDITLGDLKIKKGEIFINRRPVKEYFPGEIAQSAFTEPFRTTNTIGRFTVSAIIKGSGVNGQLGAFIHGVSRALEKVDREKFRPVLKKRGFLTRDARARQRRKSGYAQKSRAKKQSPKR